MSVLWAGCVGEPDAPAVPEPSVDDTEGDALDAADEMPTRGLVLSGPNVERYEREVEWTGSLGNGFVACEFQVTNDCQSQMVTARDNGVEVPIDARGRLMNVTLMMSWTATTPANQELVFEVMTWAGDCGTCNNTVLASETGTSPLSIDLRELALPVEAGQTVQAYAYNPQLFVHEPPVIAALYVDDAIAIAGSLTGERWGATGA